MISHNVSLKYNLHLKFSTIELYLLSNLHCLKKYRLKPDVEQPYLGVDILFSQPYAAFFQRLLKTILVNPKRISI